jgi:XTP/dITP diphosphohydrolase
MAATEIVFATGNRHKYEEISSILRGRAKIAMKKMRLEEPDLGNLEDIALLKAQQAYMKFRKPVIAEDTGVYFSEYNNFPGHMAKRVYGGIGLAGLAALIRDADNRRGFFKTVICYKDSGTEKLFSGIMRGRLLTRPRKKTSDRLPYEKLFVPDGQKKAVVELTIEEKNRISHRAKAARRLGEWLKKEFC